MTVEIVHAGFDYLKFSIQTEIDQGFRELLYSAKMEAIKTNSPVLIERGGIHFEVRRTGGAGFSVNSGDFGAEWYFQDPENRAPNNPGILVDFSAELLAVEGLSGAKVHFEKCMTAFGIRYEEHLLKVTRVDFAVDILAPWFEPEWDCVVTPAGTNGQEYAENNSDGFNYCGRRVTGLRAGQGVNRQIAIYDKRAQVIQKRKVAWPLIWNQTRAENGLPPLDLNDKDQSLVWRFEMRIGSKQLRKRFAIYGWNDLNSMIGDAFVEFVEKVTYREKTHDSNRSRWPLHEIWQVVQSTVAEQLADMRSGICGDDVRTVKREERKRMLEQLQLGLAVSQAAAADIDADEFEQYLKLSADRLAKVSKEHRLPVDERLAKSTRKVRFAEG